MKTIKFTLFLLYRYYSKGQTRDIPYFSAICVFVLFLLIHFLQIATIILMITKYDILVNNDPKIIKYFKTAIYTLPIILGLMLLVKKRDLENASYNEQKIKKGNIYLIVYGSLSLLIMFLLFILESYLVSK